MSAFLCDPKHIAILATHIADHFPSDLPTRDHAPQISLELAGENLRSLTARYSHHAEPGKPYDPAKDFMGISSKLYLSRVWLEVAKFQANPPSLPYPRLVGLLNCLAYQSCECPDYANSLASTIIAQAKALFESHFQPGEKSLGWDYVEDEELSHA